MGSREPSSAALASVVGWPSRSTAQPSGMGSPFLAALMILPRATTETEVSMTTGSGAAGAPRASGLVPRTGPGAMAGGVLAKASPTSPAWASRPT